MVHSIASLLFSPAIVVLNRLSFSRKFTLIGLVGLIAISITFFNLYGSINKEVAGYKQELVGLTIIESTTKAVQALQRHRGVSSGVLSGITEFKTLREKKEHDVDASFSNLEATLPASVKRSETWKNISSEWMYIRTNGMLWNSNDSFVAHTKLIDKLLKYETDIADDYELTADSELGAFYLAHISTNEMLDGLEHLGQIRAYGLIILGEKRVSEQRKSKMINLIAQLEDAITTLKISIDKVGRFIPSLLMPVTTTYDIIDKSSHRTVDAVRSNIINGRLSISPKDYFTLSTASIDKSYDQLYQTLLPAARMLSENRLQYAQSKLHSITVAAYLLFLIAAYFTAAIYFTTIFAINKLEETVIGFARGDRHGRVHLETRDELSVIGDSFNTMADALQLEHGKLEAANVELQAQYAYAMQTKLLSDQAQELAKAGHWCVDFREGNEYYISSERTVAIFGDPPRDRMRYHIMNDWYVNIEAADQFAAKATLSNYLDAIEGRVPRYDMIHPYKRPSDGQIIWVHVLGQVIRDSQGKPTNVYGVVMDITEEHQAEEQLRVTASVFDTSQEAILITDENNTIVDVNPAFTKITGYSHDEVIGKNPKLLSSGRQNKAFYAKMWESLNRDRAWRGEIWNRRKSGEIYAEQLSITTVCGNDDKVRRHVAVFSDISHIKAHEEALTRVAHFDALTGIPNRILLADRMKQAIAQTSREQNMMAVCYLDLDGFKPINDTMGHDAGDEVLVEVASRIGKTIRGADTVARLGGDEFVVLLLGLERGEECVATLERLLLAIAQPLTIKDHPTTVSASIGVGIYPLDDEDPDTLLRHADQAMYIAKQSGKNRFHIYDPAMDRRARDQHAFLKSVRHGLENDQFELFYQPKVNLRTKKLVGAEALIRWRHPERGLLSPGEFLRLIDNTNLDIEVGEWVIAGALAQLNRWLKAGLDIEVSINISGYHLETPGFLEKLQQRLADYPDMLPGRLQIEVLETVALNDITVVREIIKSCHEIGVGFALDDFGTGYSSLSYLSSLPVNTLKIDQSFVRDMLEDQGDMAIVQGIIALARAFGRQTVAEGIETGEHYQILLDMGCELGQGYGIARPMPASELPNWRMG